MKGIEIIQGENEVEKLREVQHLKVRGRDSALGRGRKRSVTLPQGLCHFRNPFKTPEEKKT